MRRHVAFLLLIALLPTSMAVDLEAYEGPVEVSSGACAAPAQARLDVLPSDGVSASLLPPGRTALLRLDGPCGREVALRAVPTEWGYDLYELVVEPSLEPPRAAGRLSANGGFPFPPDGSYTLALALEGLGGPTTHVFGREVVAL